MSEAVPGFTEDVKPGFRDRYLSVPLPLWRHLVYLGIALAVCYSFGGTPPLNIERVRLVNIEQYKLAYKCYTEYLALLTATVNRIESVEKS